MTENNWKLVDAFFDKYDLVDHHIKSYNDFVNNRIQNIIDITEPITLDDGKYTLKTYELVEINENTQKKANEQQKDITKEFISKDDLKAIEEKFEGKLSKLQSKIDKLSARKIIEE